MTFSQRNIIFLKNSKSFSITQSYDISKRFLFRFKFSELGSFTVYNKMSLPCQVPFDNVWTGTGSGWLCRVGIYWSGCHHFWIWKLRFLFIYLSELSSSNTVRSRYSWKTCATIQVKIKYKQNANYISWIVSISLYSN